jgi:hypothetical protein
MLRHACGFALANRGHDTRALQAYLGHRNIQAHGAVHRVVADALQRSRSSRRPSEPSGERDGTLPSSRSDISNRRDGSLVWASSCDARTKLTREEPDAGNPLVRVCESFRSRILPNRIQGRRLRCRYFGLTDQLAAQLRTAEELCVPKIQIRPGRAGSDATASSRSRCGNEVLDLDFAIYWSDRPSPLSCLLTHCRRSHFRRHQLRARTPACIRDK